MNLDQLERKLLAAARANLPSDAVPYGFERRIMGLLRSSPKVDEWALWARALWQATTPCIAIVLILVAWILLSPASIASNNGPGSTTTVDVAQQFENTVLAAADPEPATDYLQ
jgi:hypothetical protein